MPRRLSLVIASLVVSAAVVPSADANPPVKIDFVFRFDVELASQYPWKNLAPWYTYFPYDPHVHGQAPQYPSWPRTWPPTAPAPKDAMGRMMVPMLPPMLPPPTRPAPGTGPIAYRPMAALTPVSYAQPVYYGAPSYWYGR
jgi:hypothetical protein